MNSTRDTLNQCMAAPSPQQPGHATVDESGTEPADVTSHFIVQAFVWAPKNVSRDTPEISALADRPSRVNGNLAHADRPLPSLRA